MQFREKGKPSALTSCEKSDYSPVAAGGKAINIMGALEVNNKPTNKTKASVVKAPSMCWGLLLAYKGLLFNRLIFRGSYNFSKSVGFADLRRYSGASSWHFSTAALRS
ncbi:MAG: hypothetical protein K0R55_3935 [Sporomusa sp.]|nr:hypothetical protein [Sporomusa sp.]